MKKTTSKAKVARSPAKERASGSVQSAVSAKPALPESQLIQSDLFEKAVALFHSRRFAEAASLFEKAADGPSRDMAHVAKVHLLICAERSKPPAIEFSGAEDRYNYAVALINRRELLAAERHLVEALALAPNADHIHYALALSRGLRGDYQNARESLQRAIELEPRNRMHARNDADFADLARQPAIATLLFREKG
jgi:tetratricopeptide (TPR) repeat protein